MRGLLSVLFCAPAAGYAYSPMFMWSGSNYFKDQNVYVNEAVSSTSLGPLIGRLASKGAAVAEFEEYMTAEVGSPKVVLLALYDQINTEQVTSLSHTGGLQSLQSAMDSSASSMVIPYTYLNSTDNGESLANSVRNEFGEVQEVSSEQITSAEWLKELAGKEATTVLQVTMNDASTKDLLSQATAALNQATEGKYLVVLSSQKPAVLEVAERGPTSRRLLSTQGTMSPGPKTGLCANDYEHFDEESNTCFMYVYMTPAIMWGILVGVFFFFLLWIALSCLGDVQTPDVWMSKDDPGPAKGKEF